MQRVPIATQEAQVTPVITQLARGEMNCRSGSSRSGELVVMMQASAPLVKHAAPGKEVAPQVNACRVLRQVIPHEQVGAALHDQHVEMILQVLANARQMMAHGDTLPARWFHLYPRA